MVSNKEKEVRKQLKIALEEIRTIEPWFDQEVHAWIFHHSLYPVEYSGDSPEEVIKNYPKYLEIFIEHRMEGRVDSRVEKKTKGKGGYRPGAGRPKGTTKEPTKQIRVPVDIAQWLKQPQSIEQIRTFMRRH